MPSQFSLNAWHKNGQSDQFTVKQLILAETTLYAIHWWLNEEGQAPDQGLVINTWEGIMKYIHSPTAMAAAVAMVFVLTGLPQQVSAQPPDFSDCNALVGPARGLCPRDAGILHRHTWQQYPSLFLFPISVPRQLF